MSKTLVEALRASHTVVKKGPRILKPRTTDQEVERAKNSKLPNITDAQFNLIKMDKESIKEYIERSTKIKTSKG